MKQKAPPNDEAFMRGKWVSSLAGPKGLEPSTSGLTGKRPTFHTPVTPNI